MPHKCCLATILLSGSIALRNCHRGTQRSPRKERRTPQWVHRLHERSTRQRQRTNKKNGRVRISTACRSNQCPQGKTLKQRKIYRRPHRVHQWARKQRETADSKVKPVLTGKLARREQYINRKRGPRSYYRGTQAKVSLKRARTAGTTLRSNHLGTTDRPPEQRKLHSRTHRIRQQPDQQRQLAHHPAQKPTGTATLCSPALIHNHQRTQRESRAETKAHRIILRLHQRANQHSLRAELKTKILRRQARRGKAIGRNQIKRRIPNHHPRTEGNTRKQTKTHRRVQRVHRTATPNSSRTHPQTQTLRGTGTNNNQPRSER